MAVKAVLLHVTAVVGLRTTILATHASGLCRSPSQPPVDGGDVHGGFEALETGGRPGRGGSAVDTGATGPLTGGLRRVAA